MDGAQASKATSIIVVPRERFSLAPEALDRLLELTPPGYQLIYVDAGSPPHIADALRERATRHGFPLVRLERMLSPNHARNVALQLADRPYVVFLDNDTLVSAGWLQPLVACAEETGAGIVGPLYLHGRFEDDLVHMAGGVWQAEQRDGKGWVAGDHIGTMQKRSAVSDLIRRQEVGFMEFHCMLVRHDLLQRMESFDERMQGTGDHIDIAQVSRAAGRAIYVEPESVVAFIPTMQLQLFDLSYFTLRWSRAWNEGSLDALAAKWAFDLQSKFIKDQRDWTSQYGAQFGIAMPAPEVARRTIPANSAVVAQTNIALYRQMQFEDYGAAALQLVQRAYAVAQPLFGSVFCTNGKPLLAHTVGTASVLASYRQPAPLLAAALLHAAYSHGRWDEAFDLAERRRHLTESVGGVVERLVFAYHNQQCDRTVPDDADVIGLMSGDAGIAVVLAIANQIEHCVDGGYSFAPNRPEADADRLKYWQAIAAILHLPGLARSLGLALAQAK